MSKKHAAIINVQVEVHEILDSGECSGKPVKLSQFPELGLKNSRLVILRGETLEECLQKLKGKMEVLKNE